MRLPLSLLTLVFLCSCAHRYFYTPEVSGEGAVSSQRGTLFSIPPGQPQFEMLLAARRVRKAPDRAHLPAGTEMMHLRMLFSPAHDAANGAQAFVFPKEQNLVLEGGMEIPPTLVRASRKVRHRVRITQAHPEIVDLFYALPKGVDAEHLQWVSLQWEIHLSDGQIQKQLTRFDRHDRLPQHTEGFADFTDNNEVDQAEIPPGMLGDWGWWPGIF